MTVVNQKKVLARDACTLTGVYCQIDNKPQSIDSLKLDAFEWRRVQRALDRTKRSSADAANDRRHHRSEGLNLMPVVIEVVQPGGTANHIVSRGYNISASGLGFLHGRYVYPESRCTVWLTHASEGLTPVMGTVRWCTHLIGKAHLSGLELDDLIDVYRYLPQSDEATW